jgi:S-DNA-T family DNA segregation ATPase FtsK/SpoIIIE
MPLVPIKTSKKDSFGSNLPPLSLLGEASNYTESKAHAETIKNVLNKSFKDFGLDCSVTNYKVAPSIIRYYISLSATTKIRELTALKEDLSARVKNKKLRISTSDGVVIDIPNAIKHTVLHRDIMEELLSKDLPQLTMACGRDIDGEAHYIDLEKAPHLLVGGITGGGKSVCINSLIVSLLMRNSPEHLKFIMIDPKVIELTFFTGLPHLLFPVATTLEESEKLIKWCVEEMKRRYIELKKIKRKNLADIPIDKRPFPIIILVIDELAEITISKKSDELTDDLCSLARMARASGIHMILVTQRPDKEAIPGQLKFNIPSAISLPVKKDYESRIVLGQEGAEKLSGKGDMLVKSIDDEEAVRCQGSFLSEKQLEDVVEWWKEKCYPHQDKETAATDGENDEDEIMPKINFIQELEEPIISDESFQDENESYSNTSQAELTLRRNICEFRISNNDAEIQIPTIRDLAAQLNISVKPVYKILELLREEGWIKTIGANRYAKTIVTISREDAEEWVKNFQ